MPYITQIHPSPYAPLKFLTHHYTSYHVVSLWHCCKYISELRLQLRVIIMIYTILYRFYELNKFVENFVKRNYATNYDL